MEFIFSTLKDSILGAFLLPAGLLLLGFTPLGPLAHSFASLGIGGAGGGAAFGFSFFQWLGMKPLIALLWGAISGAVVGILKLLL
jgi:hypothetical protein